ARAPKLVVEYYTGTASTATVTSALRFQNINVPRGVTVTGARLECNAQKTSSDTTNLTIRAERSGNSAALTTAVNNISSRTATTASVAWTGVSTWVAGGVYTSPELTSVVQEVVSYAGASPEPGWCGGSAMTFLIGG